jgi:hypothetical protein
MQRFRLPPPCAQCRTPMTIDRVVPHRRLVDTLITIFRCETCSLKDCIAVPSNRLVVTEHRSDHLHKTRGERARRDMVN